MRHSVLAVMLALLGGCADGDGSRRERAPAAVERRLPLDLVLANLCPGTETEPHVTRQLRRQAEVLLREAREHPDWLVEWTFHDAHGDDETRLITIRQLAKEHLDSIRGHGEPCEPKLTRELEAVVR